MDFSLRRVEKENLHYYESDQESKIQLIFVSGGFNPELWKHQLRYFSRKYKTIGFQPTQSFRDWEGERNALENILEQDRLDNVVLISNIWGNALSQEFEDHGKVTAMVFTGINRQIPKKSRSRYNFFWNFGTRKPKILKKLIFSKDTEYRVVKNFVDDIDVPNFKNLESFRQHSIQRPEKPSLVIHAEEDKYSSIELARELRGFVSISVIERAGTFSFYEKPQEYNKALSDFLSPLEDAIEEKQIIETREKNRSLFEFEGMRADKNRQRQEKLVRNK